MAEEEGKARPVRAGATDFAWSLFGLLGLLFLIVGGTDLVLLWYPAQLGNAQWEFGTPARMLESMPLVTLGLVLSLGAGLAVGRRWWVVTLSILMLFMALAVVTAVFLFVTDIPLALGAVND